MFVEIKGVRYLVCLTQLAFEIGSLTLVVQDIRTGLNAVYMYNVKLFLVLSLSLTKTLLLSAVAFISS